MRGFTIRLRLKISVSGAARHLAADGLLVVYGPYRVDGRHTAPSNEAFDREFMRRWAAAALRLPRGGMTVTINTFATKAVLHEIVILTVIGVGFFGLIVYVAFYARSDDDE